MPSRRSASRSSSTMGSHMSAAEVDAIAAEQPALLAAAGKKKAAVKPTIAKSHGARKLDFKSLVRASPRAGGAGRIGSKQHKVASAVLTFVRAKYQKGDKEGNLTGAVYMRGKPRFALNEKWKDEANKKLLAEVVRWNDELKLYTAKVYTAKQANMLFKVMEDMSPECKADLAEQEPIDFDELFNFPEAKDYTIQSFPLEVEGKTVQAFGGGTYAFKSILTKHGFEFKNTVNGLEGACLWLGSLDEVEELENIITEYGFPLDKYDAAILASDDEDNDE
jgi:hypothetical protein